MKLLFSVLMDPHQEPNPRVYHFFHLDWANVRLYNCVAVYNGT